MFRDFMPTKIHHFLQLQHDISTSSGWAVGCRGSKKSSQHRIDNLLRHVVYIDRCVFNLLSLVVSFVNVFDCFDIWCLNRPETWKLSKHSTLNVAMNDAGVCWYQFFGIFLFVFRVRITFLPPVRFLSLTSFPCFVRRHVLNTSGSQVSFTSNVCLVHKSDVTCDGG